jgi:hypothetical protein
MPPLSRLARIGLENDDPQQVESPATPEEPTDSAQEWVPRLQGTRLFDPWHGWTDFRLVSELPEDQRVDVEQDLVPFGSDVPSDQVYVGADHSYYELLGPHRWLHGLSGHLSHYVDAQFQRRGSDWQRLRCQPSRDGMLCYLYGAAKIHKVAVGWTHDGHMPRLVFAWHSRTGATLIVPGVQEITSSSVSPVVWLLPFTR